MNLNCIVFPAPRPFYFGEGDFRQDGSLIFVPIDKRNYNSTFEMSKNTPEVHPESVVEELKERDKKTFPCFYIPYELEEGSSKIIIYLHGNAEDL